VIATDIYATNDLQIVVITNNKIFCDDKCCS